MTTVTKLDARYIEDIKAINCIIRQTLPHPDWFMPFTDEMIDRMFDSDSDLTVYGALIDGTLAAVSLYDRNRSEFDELLTAIGFPHLPNTAELGVCMTLPTYRGKNLMYTINTALVKDAKANGYSYFVATAHPDNIASNTSLKKLGMTQKATILRAEHYLRNVYWMELL